MPRIKWGVFLLIAGGTALGNVITTSNVGGMIAEVLTPIADKGPLAAIIVFSILGCFFANIMTITGCIALIGPIVITTMSGLGYNPIPFLLLVYAGLQYFYLPAIFWCRSSYGIRLWCQYEQDGKMGIKNHSSLSDQFHRSRLPALSDLARLLHNRVIMFSYTVT